MTLRDVIFIRRSVRKYSTDLPSKELQDEALKIAREAEALEGQKARFELAGKDSVSGGSAPCYILGYSDNTDAGLANIGYQLQKADLFLQGKGLGSIWLGGAKPKASKDKEGFGLLLAFGKTAEPARTGEKDFTRLPVGEISNEDNPVANAVRLAPSAVNFQPWQLVFSPGKLEIKYKGRGPMKIVPAIKRMNKLDVGIATRHAVLELEAEGKTILSVKPEGNGNSFSAVISYK
jgi:nitroreductase